MSSLVSIIVPIYNAKDSMEQCIKSLLEQTYKNIEIILIDDGSTDGSYELCDKYTDNDNIILIHKSNGGVSSARNKGIEVAKGNYICFVDADDIVDKQYIESMYNNMSKDIDLVVCNYYIYDLIKKISYKSNIENKEYKIKEIISDYWGFFSAGLISAPWNKMFKASIINQHNIRFPININMGEDGYFVNEYLHFSKKVKVIEDVLYKYYIYPSQSSKKIFENYFEMMNKNFDKIESLLELVKDDNNSLANEKHSYEYLKVIKESIRFIILSNEKNKKKKIDEICCHERTNKLIKKCYKNSFQDEILKRLILAKSSILIMIIYNIYYKRKRIC